jgi:hypothetical protein
MAGGASGRGGAHHRQRRAHRRPSLPVEELCLLEKKEKRGERNGGRLTLSSVVENEASVFFCSLRTSESKHYRYSTYSIYFMEYVRYVLKMFFGGLLYLYESWVHAATWSCIH